MTNTLLKSYSFCELQGDKYYWHLRIVFVSSDLLVSYELLSPDYVIKVNRKPLKISVYKAWTEFIASYDEGADERKGDCDNSVLEFGGGGGVVAISRGTEKTRFIVCNVSKLSGTSQCIASIRVANEVAKTLLQKGLELLVKAGTIKKD